MPETQHAIVKAIVALNFNDPAEALDILLAALSDCNFQNVNAGSLVSHAEASRG